MRRNTTRRNITKLTLLILIFILLNLLVSCEPVQVDGSTSVQEVYTKDLYDEGVYLDKGSLKVIIEQYGAIEETIKYYTVNIYKIAQSETKPFVTINKDFPSSWKDIQLSTSISQRGHYRIEVKGYAEKLVDSKTINILVVTGTSEDFTVEGKNKEVTVTLKDAGHTMVYHEEVPASCTESGTRAYYYCLRCEKYFSDAQGEYEISFPTTIPPLEHSTVFIKEVKATCTTYGVKEHYECSRCHLLFEDENATTQKALEDLKIERTEHNWERVQKDANLTCTWDECTYCGETQNLAGHEWDDGTVILEPTETTCGIKHYVCTNGCGRTKDEDICPLDSADHTHTWSDIETIDGTCIESGYTLRECLSCGATYKYKYKDAIGHTNVLQNAVEPTCTVEGNLTYYICNVCHKLFKDTNGINSTTESEVKIEPLGHTYSTSYDSNEEQHWHKCIRCDAIKDKSNHVFDLEVVEEKYIAGDATCTKSATYYKSCVCGKASNETFEVGSPLGHQTPLKHIEATSPTCKENGYIDCYLCERCENFFSDSLAIEELSKEKVIIPKTGHKMTWLQDANEHWWGCVVCGEEEPNTRASHVYDQKAGDTQYCKCGRTQDGKQITTSGGFAVIEDIRTPMGHFSGTGEEVTVNGKKAWKWTLTFQNDNQAHPSEVLYWYVENKKVDEYDGQNALVYTLKTLSSYRVRVVFQNEYSMGSYEKTIYGTDEDFD